MQAFEKYLSCALCPRECGSNRLKGPPGYCNLTGEMAAICSICVHHGEEPPISGQNGIINVFFMHCNLKCLYCQNIQISGNSQSVYPFLMSTGNIVDTLARMLEDCMRPVGFVSPSHYIPHVIEIITGLRNKGYNSVFVYNTNAFDKPESLRSLEGLIDVYLPDFKYSDAKLGDKLSGAKNYPERALLALKEMYRQKGSTLITDENGMAVSGMIVRHLVLPGYIKNSMDTLKTIAEELSPRLHVSLMAQYNPYYSRCQNPEMNRELTSGEYNSVVEAFHSLGFYRGWIQDLDSRNHYNPDFNLEKPFQEMD